MSYYKVRSECKVITARNVFYECENCGKKNHYKQPYEKLLVKEQDTSKIQREYEKAVMQVQTELWELAAKEVEILRKNKPDLGNFGYEKCPNCGQIQSWMLPAYQGARSAKLLAWPLTIITLALFAATIWFSDEYYLDTFRWWGSISQLLRCLLGFGIWVISSTIVIGLGLLVLNKTRQTKDFKGAGKDGDPTITWDEPSIIK